MTTTLGAALDAFLKKHRGWLTGLAVILILTLGFILVPFETKQFPTILLLVALGVVLAVQFVRLTRSLLARDERFWYQSTVFLILAVGELLVLLALNLWIMPKSGGQ